MAPGPDPEPFAVKIPAAVAVAFTVNPFDDWPRNSTSTVGLRMPAISYGTIALICVALTYNTGAGKPLTKTCTPLKVVGTMPPATVKLAGVAGPMLVPP